MNKDVKALKYLVEKYGKSDILNAVNELNESSSDFNYNFIKLEMAVFAVLYSLGVDITYYMVKPHSEENRATMIKDLRIVKDYIQENTHKAFKLKETTAIVFQDTPKENRFSGDFVINTGHKYFVDLKASASNSFGSITFANENDAMQFANRLKNNFFYLSMRTNGTGAKFFNAKECLSNIDFSNSNVWRQGRKGDYFIPLKALEQNSFDIPTDLARIETMLNTRIIINEIQKVYNDLMAE